MSKGKDNKPHIGIFGRRNNGKSSFINALVGQELSIVSDFAGTTTDPVKKSIEIPGIGPVILIDTAGIDDVGELGAKRVSKTLEALKTIDLAILIINENLFAEPEKKLIDNFTEYGVPFFIVHNKSDIQVLSPVLKSMLENAYKSIVLDFCSLNQPQTQIIIDTINKMVPESAYQSKSLIGDLINHGDVVLLVTPIDAEAPEGRMILPQVQTIRDTLDNDAIAVVLKERELDAYLRIMNPKPALVVTDSQVFLKVDDAISKDEIDGTFPRKTWQTMNNEKAEKIKILIVQPWKN